MLHILVDKWLRVDQKIILLLLLLLLFLQLYAWLLPTSWESLQSCDLMPFLHSADPVSPVD